MNFTFLKYFYDTAKERSVAKSAEINFVSAPAISTGIKKLEYELGVELLEHGKNKFQLTKEGILLLKSCEQIFQAIDLAKNALVKGTAESNVQIKLGITNGLNQEFWAPFLKNFETDFPQAKVIFKIGSPNQLKDWVDSNEIDFALTFSRTRPKNYEHILIHEGKFKFVVHSSLVKKKALNQFILTSNWPEVETFKKEYFKLYKESPIVKYEVESWGTIKNFVAQGLGIGIIPDYHISKSDKLISEYSFPVKLNEYSIVALFKKGSFLESTSYELVREFKAFIQKGR
ncbi:MAG: LysR family transcriptional regulator [Bdellovibrionales bacterium]|nr:LysR family transcriptional regulator [Bdellovibrionales bacterium]